MVKLSFLSALLAVCLAYAAQILDRISPAYHYSFQLPLVIPDVKTPLTTYTSPKTKVSIDYYEVEVKPVSHSFYPNLGNDTITTYEGTFPGPTFRMAKGRESVIRVINKSNKTLNFHVHGSYTRSRKYTSSLPSHANHNISGTQVS